MGPANLGRIICSVVTACLLICCGAPDPEPPTAVITAQPDTVPLGDEHQTVIELDAHSSAPRLSLVPAPPDPDEPPLEFKWRLTGSAYRVVGGSEAGPELQVTMRGDRPLHVELTVRNHSGGVASSLKTISITSPAGPETP